MTEQEQKELALFKEWWVPFNIIPNNSSEYALRSVAEAAWFARAKLDKERNETELL